jgi:hypothetical protein
MTDPEIQEPASVSNELVPAPRRRFAFGLIAIAAAFALVAGFVIYSGITARAANETRLQQLTRQASVPTVNVTYPKTSAAT